MSSNITSRGVKLGGHSTTRALVGTETTTDVLRGQAKKRALMEAEFCSGAKPAKQQKASHGRKGSQIATNHVALCLFGG